MGWIGLVGLGQSFLIFGGLGWVETWLRDIFNVMKYGTLLSVNEYCS